MPQMPAFFICFACLNLFKVIKEMYTNVFHSQQRHQSILYSTGGGVFKLKKKKQGLFNKTNTGGKKNDAYYCGIFYGQWSHLSSPPEFKRTVNGSVACWEPWALAADFITFITVLGWQSCHVDPNQRICCTYSCCVLLLSKNPFRVSQAEMISPHILPHSP